MSKTGNIGVTSQNIFPIIKKFLYSDHEIFLRELVSNAVDATQKLKTLASVGEAKGELGDTRVRVILNKNKKTLTVQDHGIGMTAEEVDKYINQIAFSGAEEFVNKYKDNAAAIIGHFGLGFYSAFMVADKVEIFSLSYQEDAKAVHWSCDGSPEYTMEETIKADLVFLAMGFTGVQPDNPIIAQLGLSQTPRTALVPDPARNIYCVGDCASGASLVVRALASGKNLNL